MNDPEMLILIQAGARWVRCVHQVGLNFLHRVTLYKTKFPQERSYQDGALTVTSEEE